MDMIDSNHNGHNKWKSFPLYNVLMYIYLHVRLDPFNYYANANLFIFAAWLSIETHTHQSRKFILDIWYQIQVVFPFHRIHKDTKTFASLILFDFMFFFVQWNQWNLIKIVFENVTLNWFCHLWNFPKYFYECVWRIVTTSDELNTHASMHKRWYHWTHIKLQTWQRCIRCCTIFKHFRIFSLRFWSLMSTTQTSI